MKLKESRTASFIIVAVIYALAAVVGIVTYRLLPTDFGFTLNLLIADVVATVFTFIFSVIMKNASVYDPYWSVQPPVIVTAFAIKYGVNLSGVLMLVAIWFWGIRLTANWAYTFKGLTHQDWRYTMLHDTTGKLYPFVNFTGIHMVPTLVVYGCTLPAVYVIIDKPYAEVWSFVFFALSVLAVILQGTADIEMHAFRKSQRGGFIRNGLWKYSRHPNYLGEITMWWGVALATVSVMPYRWYLIAGAVANTVLFLVVSIPMADKRQSKKEGFELYKKQTRMLFPIYKKQ